jgi:hypothetical protein
MNGVRARVAESASDPVARFIVIDGVKPLGAATEEISIKKVSGEHWLGKDGWQPMPARFRAHLSEHCNSLLIRLEPEFVRQIPYGCGIEISVDSIGLNLRLRWDKPFDLEAREVPHIERTPPEKITLSQLPLNDTGDNARIGADETLAVNLNVRTVEDGVGRSVEVKGNDVHAPIPSDDDVKRSDIPEPPSSWGDDRSGSYGSSLLHPDVGSQGVIQPEISPEPDVKRGGPARTKRPTLLILFSIVSVAIAAISYYIWQSAPSAGPAPVATVAPIERAAPTPPVSEPPRHPVSELPPASPPTSFSVPSTCNVPPTTSRPPAAASFRADLEIQQARAKISDGKSIEAEAMLRKAVRTGNAKAAVLLGEMQDPSIGTQTNPACAMGWYQYAEFLGIDTSSQRARLAQWQRRH